jgi:hypothetical protein
MTEEKHGTPQKFKTGEWRIQVLRLEAWSVCLEQLLESMKRGSLSWYLLS